VKIEDISFAEGAFSHIYKGHWIEPKTGKIMPVAIKCLKGVSGNPVIMKHLYHETRIWCTLSHRNVTPFLGLCHEIAALPAMISPLYDNGRNYLLYHPQADRLAITIGIARGIKYLHSKNVVHGDIDQHSILIDQNGIPRLSGFSQSQFINHRDSDAMISIGSIRYLAPERLPPLGVKFLPEATKESDVYSFSMVALQILSGEESFFYLRNTSRVINLINKGIRPERSKYQSMVLTDSVWQLLVDCWDQDPGKRPEMGTVVQRLEEIRQSLDFR